MAFSNFYEWMNEWMNEKFINLKSYNFCKWLTECECTLTNGWMSKGKSALTWLDCMFTVQSQ